jgi:hypothetical protein
MKAGVPAMDPYPLKFVYNVSQIFLCAYMTIEAGMIAYRHNYAPVCNDYNVENPPMANLLWLFYVSKIWDSLERNGVSYPSYTFITILQSFCFIGSMSTFNMMEMSTSPFY